MRKYCSLPLAFLLISLSGLCQEKKTPIYYFEKGEQSLAKKEYVSAQAHFTECLRLDPYYAEAYRLRGIAREHLGQTAQALTDYNVYIDLKPKDAEALFSRAVLRFESGQYLPARQDFLHVLTMAPGETNTVYYSQEKYNDSNARIFTAQGSNKDHVYNYLGLIETKLRRYEKAIGWLDSAIKMAPDNAGYWINRGMAKVPENDMAGARADFEHALKIDPQNSLALHNLATLKPPAGEDTYAEKLLSEAIEKNKNLPYPHAERAFQRLQKNDLKGALEDYDEVVRLEPKNEENYINRGLVKEKMNDLAGAMADFSKAIDLNTKNEKAWLCHGNIKSKQGHWKDAIDDYGVAITLEPNYKIALYNRAIAHQNAGQSVEACRDLRAAEQLGVSVDPKLKQKACH